MTHALHRFSLLLMSLSLSYMYLTLLFINWDKATKYLHIAQVQVPVILVIAQLFIMSVWVLFEFRSVEHEHHIITF